jgi:endonuclease VIII
LNMPEGDAIFRTARALHQALAGRTVARFESVLPQLTRIDEDAPLAGRVIERVWSMGKHVLIAFSGGLVLRTHLRMNGTWHIYRRGERWRRGRQHMRLLIDTDAFVAVGFNVPVAEFVPGGEPVSAAALRALGPDLLADSLDVDEAVARLRAQGSRDIAEALLDQRVLAGIGNVYKSEVCFLCRVSPFLRVDALDTDTLRRLVETARRLLQANVGRAATGGIVTRPTLRSMTGRAAPEDRVWVYGRAGKPCVRCGTLIERDRRGDHARSTYWCPRCAAMPQANSSSDG